MQSVLKCCCQSTIVGGASVHVTSHGQTALFEKGVKILVDKKNTGWMFNIIGWLCTHTAFISVQTTYKSACSII